MMRGMGNPARLHLEEDHMPTFNLLLAMDESFYGTIEVDADTWADAVASLSKDAWGACFENGNYGGDQHRIVHVEDEAGEILAEDINYDCAMLHYIPVVHRLQQILEHPESMAAEIQAYIAEITADVQHPLFRGAAK
jgi:hypothetical protein